MGTLAGRIHKEIAVRFAKRPAIGSHSAPVVSFTFDDFPRSAFTCAGAMLADKGYSGTYYASMGLAGQNTSVGKLFETSDLRELVNTGHELACHTLSHLSSHTSRSRAIEKDCAENRRRLAEILDGYEMRNFSFPSGDVTLSAKAKLSTVYDTCRTVQPGINRASIDLAFLRANSLYMSLPKAGLRNLIEQNASEKGWLILYTHDVTDSPSPYGCTPDYFREALSLAVASGATILPVKDVIKRYQPVSSAP